MTSIAHMHRPSKTPLGLILAAFLVLFAAAILALYGQSYQRIPKPHPMPLPEHIDISRSHAINQHGMDEVSRAYGCFENKNMGPMASSENATNAINGSGTCFVKIRMADGMRGWFIWSKVLFMKKRHF